MKHAQGINNVENLIPQQNRSEGDLYSGLNVQDFVGKEAQAYPSNNVDNTIPQGITPAPDPIGYCYDCKEEPPKAKPVKLYNGRWLCETCAKTEVP